MKNIILSSILFLFIQNYAAQSRILESLTMSSNLLNSEVKYSVYLPNGYDTSMTSYPVVYLLNGFSGNETDWLHQGSVKEITDELISSKKIIPMIIVMPDGDDRLYMNRDDGAYPYETMFIEEFLPFIEQTYRIKNTKQNRAISGLSMGGSGSLRLALKYHDVFGHCAAFSAGISTDEEIISEGQDSFDSYFGRVSPSIVGKKGKDRLTATIKDYDVIELVKTKNAELLRSVNIYFDCGDDDFLTVGNSQLHIELRNRKIPHEFRMRDGAHTWDYWKESLPHGLQFISQNIDE